MDRHGDRPLRSERQVGSPVLVRLRRGPHVGDHVEMPSLIQVRIRLARRRPGVRSEAGSRCQPVSEQRNGTLGRAVGGQDGRLQPGSQGRGVTA